MRPLTLLAALACLALAAGLAACEFHGRESAACETPQRRPSPSGLCLPRWVSLKSNEVLARRGPGFDYPALWTYRSRGLPVQIVAETDEWRRICDPDGGAVWVHRSMIDGRRRVLSPAAGPTPMLSNPRPGARLAATLAPRAVADLDRCQGGWCRLSAGGVSGWAPQAGLWGVAAQPQCR